MKMDKSSVPSRYTIVYLLLVIATATFAGATYVIYNNSFRSLPFFFFLMIMGMCLMLAFGLVRGGAGALVVISLWIGLKRAIGVWQDVFLLTNVLELGIVLAVFAICGVYSERLRAILDSYFNSMARLELLNLEDTRVGLIKAAIGKLRLQEEEERSVRYRRPFSLLLMQVQSNTESDLNLSSEANVMRIVANTVKSTTRRTDIPFLAASDQIALILPETDNKGANRVVSNIMNRMQEARFFNDNGVQTSLQDIVQLRYGLAAFTGNSRLKINMFQAAEQSLERTLSKGASSDFQNTSLDWEIVGDLVVDNLPTPPPILTENLPAAKPDDPDPDNHVHRFKRLLISDTAPRQEQAAHQDLASSHASPSEKIGTE